MEAADKLREIGTPDAIYGLARRFSATSENLGTDQEEKKRIQSVLVGFGDEAIEPLQRYIRSYDKVTWAIDALERLQPYDELIPFLFEVLSEGDPVRIRGEKAHQILKALETFRSSLDRRRCHPVLEESPTIRCASPPSSASKNTPTRKRGNLCSKP